MKAGVLSLFLSLSSVSALSYGQVNVGEGGRDQDMPIASVTLIGESRIDNQAQFDGVTIGGLSGIDYNPQTKQWVVISDDRGEHGPARAYLGQLAVTKSHIGDFQVSDMITFEQPDGSPYPRAKAFKQHGDIADFESVRFNPWQPQTLRYTSEGDRTLGLTPFIRDARFPSGQWLASLTIAPQIKAAINHGYYDNLTFEGSSFTPSQDFYFVAMEAPVMQDGPVPNEEHGGYSRLIKYDRQGHIVSQYLYPVDAWPALPGKGKHADNGVSEILAIDDSHLLFVERAGIQSQSGSYHNHIRLYQVSLERASNVNREDSVAHRPELQAVKKTLLLNLNDLDLSLLDNIEGITWGPRLSNGKSSLILISDNNFNRHEVTQLLAFSVTMKGE
ncbi:MULTISPECIES: esterase-like activity of phytase family protein [unclassified Vibrio]|uniref:Esterase-like activity of phytase family protein n=1 Tax=Vibrio sp. HB236076 TaxID=3232307 RepID=A0AB39HC43_9VIBR|nr:esterase-like activity of phytase family protein [Vibrio sp. HB161653]MDP5255804.1 esterase-like activity of phytase family protein [Vibrio sp. HB161653]